MMKLLILADDFTGALDTGIQFVKKGIETQVVIGTQLDLSEVSDTAPVLVVDAETRPMKSKKAHDVAARIAAQAVEMGMEVIYKKTDSALRGNVGAELSGVLDGTGEKRIYFIPAFPEVNRITEKGIHYIDGVRLEESGFGKDPFDPMTCSYVPEILGKQTKKRILTIEREEEIPEPSGNEGEIVVFDASEDRDIQKRIRELKERGELKVLAGCAGFASFLPEALGLSGREKKEICKGDYFLVTCGSLNPITKNQVEYAEKAGFARKNLSPEEKLFPGFYETPEGKAWLEDLEKLLISKGRVELDTFDLEGRESVGDFIARNHLDPDSVRFSISECFGKIVRYLVEKECNLTVLMTGGDTLMGFMKEIGVSQIWPVSEVGQGTVLSRLIWKDRVIQVISKSGGYGEEDVFVKAADQVMKDRS